jgi:beta-glucanase (GH16 family)
VTTSNGSGGKAVKFGSGSTGTQKLIFSDEFNGTSGTMPSSTLWKIYGGTKPPMWGIECFENRASNISMDGSGHLALTARHESSVPCTQSGVGLYSSGGMATQSFKFKYGRAEASIKVPCTDGTWSAWWGVGTDSSLGVSWPNGGEIDILEAYGDEPTNAAQTLHGGGANGHWKLSNHTTTSTWCNAYHTYGVQWSTAKIVWQIDGINVGTKTPSMMPAGAVWPWDTYPHNLILDLQIDPTVGGAIDNSQYPTSMLVDWVRVYQ